MALFERLRKRSKIGNQANAEGDFPSVVLLLREPLLPSAEQALEMARSAWSAAGPVELAGSVSPHCHAVRASELFFAINAAPQRYEAGPTIASQVYQLCWDHHTAWLSVDLPVARVAELRANKQLEKAYSTLLFFVYKHWSSNCLALYFPAEGVTVPNLGDLAGSIRWCRQNGTNLDFLRREKKA